MPALVSHSHERRIFVICLAIALVLGFASSAVAVSPDITAPTLSDFSLGQVGGMYAPGTSVAINYTVADPDSPIATAIFGYDDPAGHGIQIRVDNNNGIPTTGTISYPIKTTSVSGRYTLQFVDLFDPSGNRRSTFRSSNPIYSTGDFTVTGGTESNTVPAAPTGVLATAGNAEVAVSWTTPASDGGSAITGYTVTANPGGKTASTTGATSSTVTGLTNGTAYRFTVTATNTGGTSAASAASAAVTPATGLASVIRFAGTDRFATSAAIAHANYQPGVPVVYIATGLNFPDALAGGAAAANAGGPLLLVLPDLIPTQIAAELTRLTPASIVVLGGTGAVSAAVMTTLQTYTSGPVTRVAGADRYATAANLATSFPAGSPVFIATGKDFPDALAGTAAAAAQHAAILLTTPTTIPSATAAALSALAPSSITILGGTGAVSASVATQLRTYTPTVLRLSGSDRYATAAAIASSAFPSATGVFITTGAGFADALTGGPVAGVSGQPLLLATATCLPAATAAFVATDKPATVTLLGGNGALGAGVASLTTCTSR